MAHLNNISLKLSLIIAISLFSAITLVIVLIGVDYSMHKSMIKRSVALVHRDMEVLSRQVEEDILIDDWGALERVFSAYSSSEEVLSLDLISHDLTRMLQLESRRRQKQNKVAIRRNSFKPATAAQVLADNHPLLEVDKQREKIDAYYPIETPGFKSNRFEGKRVLIYMSYDLKPGVILTHYELTQTGLLFTAIGSLGLLGMLLFFRYYVTIPLHFLATASEKMAAGNYTLRLPVTGRNEIGRLERALNQFSSSSQQYIKKLKGQHQRLNDYLNSGIVGMVILSHDGVVQEMNDFLPECTDYSKEQLIRMEWSKLIHPDDRAQIPWVKRRLLNAQITEENLSFRLTAKNGMTRWIDCTLKYEPDTDDRQGYYVAFMRDVTRKRENEFRIHQLAHYDELTELPNRRLFNEKLEQAIHSAVRHKHLGAVMFIDLDFFKDVNDSLGHQIGDKLLQQVASRLEQQIRQEDTLARIGGDEFVLLTPRLAVDQDTAIASVSLIGERMLSSITQPYLVDGHKLHITASAGVSFFPRDADNLQDLLRQADTAMYQSKASGRGVVSFFSADMQEKANERLNLRNQLQQAIDEEQFELYLQPQVDVKTGEITSAECLIRWRHPISGIISPADFIPIAEESGLIIDIGDWVLKTACEQLMSLERRYPNRIKHLSVNISPRQFHSPGFVKRVKALIKELHIDPGKLCFELTENLLVDSLKTAIAIANQLKSNGILFSIDDFGTGYSSLSYLTQLPLDEIKIDKSFIDHVPEKKRDTTIVETIISMAHHMGAKVVAEGVESKAQFDFLKAKHCESYQGYLTSRPVDFESFCNLIESQEATDNIHSCIQQCVTITEN